MKHHVTATSTSEARSKRSEAAQISKIPSTLPSAPNLSDYSIAIDRALTVKSHLLERKIHVEAEYSSDTSLTSPVSSSKRLSITDTLALGVSVSCLTVGAVSFGSSILNSVLEHLSPVILGTMAVGLGALGMTFSSNPERDPELSGSGEDTNYTNEEDDKKQSSRRRELQRDLDDKISEHFSVPSKVTAQQFLNLFRVDNLHDFIHRSLGHSSKTPIHWEFIRKSEYQFMKHLSKNVELFLASEPSNEQVREFLMIPQQLKLSVDDLKGYDGLIPSNDTLHDLTYYYWNTTARAVHQSTIPKITKTEDLVSHLNIDYPEMNEGSFHAPLYRALILATQRGFEIGGEDLRWLHGLRGFDEAIERAGFESPLGVFSEVALDGGFEPQSDDERISRVIQVLCGNYLEDRLISRAGEEGTFRTKLDELLRQPIFNEDPKDVVRPELRAQREFLFSFLAGRQSAGCELPCPQSEAELAHLIEVGRSAGYLVTGHEGKLCIRHHIVEEYGETLQSIAVNVRKLLRAGTFETASDFVAHFDPDCLPQVASVPYDEFNEPSDAKKREWALQELLITVFFQELERALPKFHELHPSARDVRSLLELHGKVQRDIRYMTDASFSHDNVMWELFERYLGGASSIQDWTTIVTYRTEGAYEFEAQQRAAYNHYFWRAVELGDEGLLWMEHQIWGNNALVSKFNAANTIRTLVGDLPQSERTDENIMRRAVALSCGGFLRERAKEVLSDDPMNRLRVAIAAISSGIPAAEFDPSQIDPKQLDRIERNQKEVMLKYLMARQSAGNSVKVPGNGLELFVENAMAHGYEVTAREFLSAKDDAVQVYIQPLQERGSKRFIALLFKGIFENGVRNPLRFFSQVRRAWKRGWW